MKSPKASLNNFKTAAPSSSSILKDKVLNLSQLNQKEIHNANMSIVGGHPLSTYASPDANSIGGMSNGFKNNAKAIIKGNLLRNLRQPDDIQYIINHDSYKQRPSPYSSLQPSIHIDNTSKESIEGQLRAQLNLRGVKGLSHNGSPMSANGYPNGGGKSVAFINVLPM
jgi:hypothetical protein